eukprot:g12747.t1
MAEIRRRIAAKTYVCAPNFWDDLRATLKAIEERRDERAAKSKAQQVLKQIARLEVKFWAKASVAMLKELDAESRLERIVLSDVTLQKDFEAPQREALSAAVRENLQKFPVEMQAVLERVGTVTEPRSFGVPDWRRRHQPTQLDAPTLGPGAKPQPQRRHWSEVRCLTCAGCYLAWSLQMSWVSSRYQRVPPRIQPMVKLQRRAKGT